jgi:hypothetical protein
MALGPHFFSECFLACVLTLGAHSADDACGRKLRARVENAQPRARR